MKSAEDIKKIAISALLLEKALDSLGIYPQAVVGKYEKRSDFQNGWNEAIMECRRNVVLFGSFLSDLDPLYKQAFETLLLNDWIEISNEDGEVKLWLLTNDIFCFAADGEDIEVTDLPGLADIYERFGYEGIVAWVAIKRKEEPLRSTPEYVKAKKYLECINNG